MIIRAEYGLVITVDSRVDPSDLNTVAWQVLGNSDPKRDHIYLSGSSLLIDGTIKAFRTGGFSRKWPNVVCSDIETINTVDSKWESLQLGNFIQSPSIKSKRLQFSGNDEVITGLLQE